MKNKKYVLAIIMCFVLITTTGCRIEIINENSKNNQEEKDKCLEGYELKDDECVLIEERDYYIVKFDSNGGSEVEEINADKDTKIKQPKNPTRKGYTFVGWYYNNEQFDFNEKITKDITLVAVWKNNSTTNTSTKTNTNTSTNTNTTTKNNQTTTNNNTETKKNNSTQNSQSEVKTPSQITNADKEYYLLGKTGQGTSFKDTYNATCHIVAINNVRIKGYANNSIGFDYTVVIRLDAVPEGDQRTEHECYIRTIIKNSDGVERARGIASVTLSSVGETKSVDTGNWITSYGAGWEEQSFSINVSGW